MKHDIFTAVLSKDGAVNHIISPEKKTKEPCRTSVVLPP